MRRGNDLRRRGHERLRRSAERGEGGGAQACGVLLSLFSVAFSKARSNVLERTFGSCLASVTEYHAVVSEITPARTAPWHAGAERELERERGANGNVLYFLTMFLSHETSASFARFQKTHRERERRIRGESLRCGSGRSVIELAKMSWSFAFVYVWRMKDAANIVSRDARFGKHFSGAASKCAMRTIEIKQIQHLTDLGFVRKLRVSGISRFWGGGWLVVCFTSHGVALRLFVFFRNITPSERRTVRRMTR